MMTRRSAAQPFLMPLPSRSAFWPRRVRRRTRRHPCRGKHPMTMTARSSASLKAPLHLRQESPPPINIKRAQRTALRSLRRRIAPQCPSGKRPLQATQASSWPTMRLLAKWASTDSTAQGVRPTERAAAVSSPRCDGLDNSTSATSGRRSPRPCRLIITHGWPCSISDVAEDHRSADTPPLTAARPRTRSTSCFPRWPLRVLGQPEHDRLGSPAHRARLERSSRCARLQPSWPGGDWACRHRADGPAGGASLADLQSTPHAGPLSRPEIDKALCSGQWAAVQLVGRGEGRRGTSSTSSTERTRLRAGDGAQPARL